MLYCIFFFFQLLAGMNKAAGPELAAAVSNAGGLGVMGGNSLSPRLLQITINNYKNKLHNKNSPFGIDLLLPKIGGTLLLIFFIQVNEKLFN